MKGKRHTTEDKIRLLREADRGERAIQAICQEANISEVTFHRWKKQFGHMEVNEARRLKELERENTELKKMLAVSRFAGSATMFSGGSCGQSARTADSWSALVRMRVTARKLLSRRPHRRRSERGWATGSEGV